MAKKKRFKIESTDSKEKKKIVYLQLPDSKENKEAQLAYNTAFREALQSGAVLRQKLNQVMQEQGVWDDEKEAEYNGVLQAISDGEKALGKGGISLSEARGVALSIRKSRTEFRGLIAERSSMDGNTAEGQADNERFSHLVYTCILDEKGERLFTSKEEYEENSTEPYVLEVAGQLAEKLYGLDPDYEQNLTENKFLKDYKFSDHELRLVNKEGHLIDIDEKGNERLINEDGRFIAYNDDGESHYVDRDGKLVDEEGEYNDEFVPFLDDSGNPVNVPEEDKGADSEVEVILEEEEEENEEEEVAEEKPKASSGRGRPKKSQSKTQTE